MNTIRALRPLRTTSLSKVSPWLSTIRPFTSSHSRFALQEQKDAQLDREKMNTESNEGTKTGTDTSSAAQEDAAFNRQSDPQTAKEKAGEGNQHNPLDASGANPELGKPTSEESSGAGDKTGS